MRRIGFFKRKAPAEAILYICVSAMFMVVAISYIYIFVFAFIASLKTHTEVVMNPFGLPEIWQWQNYKDILNMLKIGDNNFWDMTFNSLYFSIVGTLLGQYISMTFAYACTKYKFPGSDFIYTLIMVVITLPIYGASGARYRLLYSLGWIDSYAYVLTSCSGFGMGYLFYRSAFQNMSWAYAEAVMIDGGNAFDIYYRVMAPQMKPLFGALFVTNWLMSWNSLTTALIYHPNLPTLPVGIYQFSNEMIYRARMDVLFAACVVVCIPALIVFVAFNKTITTSVSIGGLKG